MNIKRLAAVILALAPMLAGAADMFVESYSVTLTHPGAGAEVVTIVDSETVPVAVALPAMRDDAREYTLHVYCGSGGAGTARLLLLSTDGYMLADVDVPAGGGWVEMASPWADVWWRARGDAELVAVGADVTMHTQSATAAGRAPYMTVVRVGGSDTGGCN